LSVGSGFYLKEYKGAISGGYKTFGKIICKEEVEFWFGMGYSAWHEMSCMLKRFKADKV